MHILLIHQFFLEDDAGGGGRWNETARIWKSRGHEVTVLAGTVNYLTGATGRRAGGQGQKNVNRDRVTVLRCGASYRYRTSFGGRLLGYFSFMGCAFRHGVRAGRHCDVIVATSPPLFTGVTAWALSLVLRVPFVFEVRDLWPESAVQTGVLRRPWLAGLAAKLEKWIYGKASLVSVLTPAFRKVLTEQKGVPHGKIVLVPNAADFRMVREVTAELDIAAFRRAHHLAGRFVILYAGAHGIANHLEVLLDAAALLCDTNVLFLLVGDGMQKQVLQEKARRQKLANVRFVPPVSRREVFRYMLAADMGAAVLKKLPVFKTVYSNKTFDYFACRKPVLMGIDGISRELVEEARAGVFVRPEDPQDFALKVKSYLNDPARVVREGQNGYDFVRKHFDREALAVRYIEHISQKVKAGRCPDGFS